MKTLILIAALFAPQMGKASNYPADYSIGKARQTQGPVAVERAIQVLYGLTALDVKYVGPLVGTKGLKVWVKVHNTDRIRKPLLNLAIPESFASLAAV